VQEGEPIGEDIAEATDIMIFALRNALNLELPESNAAREFRKRAGESETRTARVMTYDL